MGGFLADQEPPAMAWWGAARRRRAVARVQAGEEPPSADFRFRATELVGFGIGQS